MTDIKKMKYDVSIIIPSIRIQNLPKIYFMIEKAIEYFNFELIVVGPHSISDSLWSKENVRFIKDFGCPSRCVQLASAVSEGKYLAWLSDDCTFMNPNSLAQCITLLEEKNNIKNAVCLRYFEGEGSGEFEQGYWRAKHHGDMKSLDGIPENYNIAPLAMYNVEYFKQIGGLDCRFNHINLCTHDLAFRLQNDNGKIFLSPQTVARFYWSWITSDATPIQKAYFEVDAPLFKDMWDKDQSNRIKIDYNNWTDQESKWSLRFGK